MATKSDRVELTNTFVRSLKPNDHRYVEPGQSKRFIVWDAEQVGLGVRVTPNGHKSFIVVRPLGKGGTSVMDTLGSFTNNNLAQIRQQAKQSIEHLADEKRPRELRERRQGGSVLQAVEDYLEHLRGLKSPPRSLTQTESYLRRGLCGQERDDTGSWRDARQAWRTRKASEIRRPDAKALLREVAKDGKPFAARNTHQIARRCFGWLAREEKHGVLVNPFAGIDNTTFGLARGDLRRDRELGDRELSMIWKAAGDQGVFGSLVRCLMLTGQRVMDLALATTSELEGEWLTIAAKRYKTGRPHEVWLSPTVLELVAEARARWPSSPWLFPHDGKRPVAVNSYRKRALDEAIGQIAPWVLHDLRAAVLTGMLRNELADFFVAEMVLGHTIKGTAAHYMRAVPRAPKAEALRRWHDHVLEIVEP